jgi:two-component system sensor histidine kinase KdpD
MGKLVRYSELSFASPLEIEHAAQVLAAARRGFLTTGDLTLCLPRPMILESWRRCVAHVDPSRREVALAVASESELHDLRLANEPLLRAAGPILRRLGDLFDGSGYILGLADPQGHLLDVMGEEAARRRLERFGLTPGGDWSEAAAGTNGIGTALKVGHGVQVLGPEHYCDGWQDITCITALVRHPLTGAVMGALDISGDYNLARPFFSGFLTAYALETKQALRAILATPRDDPAPFRIASLDFSGGARVAAPSGPLAAPYPLPFDEADASSGSGGDLQSRLDLQQRRARDAEHLALAACCVTASLDLQVTLKQVVERATHLLGVDTAAVCLLDDLGQANMLRVCSRTGPSRTPARQAIEALLHEDELVALARENGEPIVVDDARVAAAPGLAATGWQWQFRSFVLLPMMSTRGAIGFIVALHSASHRWSADEVRLGLALAAQAATAIENARLFETLQQHHRNVQALNTVNQLLNTLLDPSQHLDLIVEQIAVIMELDAGLVMLGGRQDDLTIAASYGVPATIGLHLDAYPWRMLRELAGAVVSTGEPMLICGQSTDPIGMAGSLRASGFCDVMVAPLVVSGEILGALMLGSYQHRGLTEANLTLFTSIGQQLGLALKNAQLLRSASEMEALREVDRLKSRFLMTVSHDLRSPLTAIRTSVESLLDQKGVQSQRGQRQLLNNIADQARRLGRLVDQLLDLSRIEARALTLDRDWTELPALITDTIAEFMELNCSCQVELNLAAELPLAYVDPDRLVQVLWNLMENAHKYGPPDGPIRVDAEWAGDVVLIGVADRGPGIPADEREKIFQYFYRLDRGERSRPQGSGLGLAICRGILDAHGGRIWVEDRPGGGSVFRFALPPNPPGGLAALEGRDLAMAREQAA